MGVSEHERWERAGPHGCGEDVAPYLLGALVPADTERFERHLEGCPHCRDDVERLRPVVDVLPALAEEVAPPPELRARIMAEVNRSRAARPEREPERRPRPAWRRRPRPLAGLALACVALLAGLALAGGLSGAEDPRTVTATVAAEGAHGELRVEGEDGTLRVRGLPQPAGDRVWQVWVVHETGPPVPTDALFGVDHAGSATVDVPADLRDVVRVLVSEEPRGGSPAPTTSPTVSVAL
jgi:anti-sigma-K factor RskA